MPYLFPFTDLGMVQRQAEDLAQPDLSAAQHEVAVSYGFESWPALLVEVERRQILNSRDLTRLAAFLAEHPEQAIVPMRNWCDHKGASPLGYMAMLKFDARRLGLGAVRSGTGTVTQALIDAGALVDGDPGDKETPLITAASYGDAEVAAVLVKAGADLEARSAADSGGVPDSTALGHAAVFGMTEVLDVLVAAGARVHSIEEAAAAGDIQGWLTGQTPSEARLRALIMAADHQRLPVIDQLLDAGTPIDAVDGEYGRQALRLAAENGRPAAVAHLLERGADPNLRDPDRGHTALDLCRHKRAEATETRPYDQVEALLVPVTTVSEDL